MAHGTTASDVVLFLKREVAVCKDLLLELKLALSDAHVDENTQSAVFEEIQLFARRCMSAMREQCDASLQHWRSGDDDSELSTPRASTKIVIPSPFLAGKQKHSPRRSAHSPRHSRHRNSASPSGNEKRGVSLDISVHSAPDTERTKGDESDSDEDASGGIGGAPKTIRPVAAATTISGRRYNTMASTPRSTHRKGPAVNKEVTINVRDASVVPDGFTKSHPNTSESLLQIKMNDKGRVTGKEFRPRSSSVGRAAHEIVTQKGPRGIYPSILATGTFPSLRIDLLVDEPGPVELDMRDDLYQFYFFLHEHVNFIVAESDSEHYVISVLTSPTSPDTQLHRALKTTKKGYHEFDLHISPGSSSFADRAELALQQSENGKAMWQPTNHFDFCRSFASLEVKHPQKRSGMKIGVICVRPGQTELKQMFENGLESTLYLAWMNVMGNELDLKEWHGYRGDMGHEGLTYFDEWRGVSTMYHLAPLMNSEGHRRLIGNDVNVIFFLDGDIQFDPAWVSQLGTVPQIFGVVKPDGSNYRLAFFNNVNIKSYGPEAGLASVKPAVMKETVLTKMYNGLVMTTYCPPLNRLFFLPRGQTLENIVAQYTPADLKKKKGKKDKSEEKRSNRASALLPNFDLFSKKPRLSSESASKLLNADESTSESGQ